MNSRDYMIAYRKAQGLTIDQMAKKCAVSPTLLRMLEDDDQCVTSVKIVKRIAKQYPVITKAQKLGMIPPNYRPGPDYNPDRYKLNDAHMFKEFKVVPMADLRSQ